MGPASKAGLHRVTQWRDRAAEMTPLHQRYGGCVIVKLFSGELC